MKKTIDRILMMSLCVAFASCNSQPDPLAVAKEAIRDAEREIGETMMREDEPDGPFFLQFRYPALVNQQRTALNGSADKINKAMGVDEEAGSDDEKAYEKLAAKRHIADSLKDIARDYIRNHYRQPIEDAIAEIDGIEFPCYYNSEYVQSAQAFVQRDPNDLQGQAVRLRVEMVLGRPSLNHTVVFVKNGVPPTPGYGNRGAERFFRMDDGSRYRYDPGTPVRFFVSMQYGEVITIENFYIQEYRYQ